MATLKHGESASVGNRTPEYVAWANMIERCENSSLPDFHRYGGRGVRVCDRWRHDYAAFLADVGRRPSKDHSLDRFPDRDGNYEPGNVRWATWHEQQRNRTNNRLVDLGGRRLCLAEVAEATGTHRKTIALRLSKGEPPEIAVRPAYQPIAYEYMGTARPLSEISRLSGVPGNSLRRRIERHGSLDAAIAAWHANNRGKKPHTKGQQ